MSSVGFNAVSPDEELEQAYDFFGHSTPIVGGWAKMRVNFAHLRERTTSGQYVDFAIFDANATTGRDEDRADLLRNLTTRAQSLGLIIDASALVYREHGENRSYGDPIVVDYLKRGLPRWTHYLDV